MKKVCVVVASIGKNLSLAHEIVDVLKARNVEVHLLNIVEMNLPLYTSKAESEHSAENLIAHYKHHLSSDGLIFVAPEYNGGLPPTLNNFIAWVSRSTKNWREIFNAKPAMIATASGGGGVQALAIMRLQLSFIGMNVLGRQIVSTMGKPHQAQEVIDTCESFLKTI